MTAATALRALSAEGRFAEALDVFQRLADRDPPPELRLIGATCAARVGEYALAWDHGEAAHQAFVRQRLDWGRMRALNLLGGIAFERGRMVQAETYFTEVLRFAQADGAHRLAARALNNLGSIDHLRDRLRPATARYLRALCAWEAAGDLRGRAQTHHNLGLVCRDHGFPNRAAEHVDQAIELAGRADDAGLLALVTLGRAELQLALGDLKQAARDLVRGATLAECAGDQHGQADAHRVWGLLALRRGEAETARREGSRARGLASALQASLLQAECDVLIAWALRLLGREEPAERHYHVAMAVFRRQGAVHLLRRAEREWFFG